MTLALMIFFGMIISKSDFRRHQIHNRDLLFFFIASAVISYRDLFRFTRLTAATFVVCLLISILMGIGMGDVKLIAVLIPLLGRGHHLNVISLLSWISLTSLVAAVIAIVRNGKISLHIPWAPSLFAASILYLATQ